jgi:hypothetical protein
MQFTCMLLQDAASQIQYHVLDTASDQNYSTNVRHLMVHSSVNLSSPQCMDHQSAAYLLANMDDDPLKVCCQHCLQAMTGTGARCIARRHLACL